MQLKKTSKKTSSKIAENTVAAAAPETPAAPQATSAPRAGRASKTKKNEGSEMTSGKHLHKPASPAVAEHVAPQAASFAPGIAGSSIAPTAAAVKHEPAKAVADREAIAQLAYSYWLERGGAHGSAEQDWLRAENELAGR